MSDSRTKLITHTRRNVLAGAAAALPLLGRRARAAEPISIGWVGPLSPPGGYAEGTNMKNAAEIAATEINAQGGILGRQVEIIYADTRGMPAEGRTAAERLVQQNKVVAVFGEFHSPVALAEMEVYHKYGIPFMACDVWSDQITAKGYPEVFRNAPAVSLIDVTIGQWIAAAGFKNVAIIAEKDDVGLAARTLVQQELDQGRRQVHRGRCRSEPDRLHRADPALQERDRRRIDFFLSVYAEAGAYPMIRQAHDLGFAPTAHLRHLQFRRRGGRSDLLGERRRRRQVAGHRERRPAEGGVERQDQGVRREIPREAQRRSVRRGDGELRRRLAAVRRDQAGRRHRREGDHQRAGEHQLCRRARQVLVLHQ